MASYKQRKRRGGPSAPGAASGRGRHADARPGDDGAAWLYGIHPVRAALANPRREVLRLLVAAGQAAQWADVHPGPEAVDRAAIEALVGADTVHQGVAAEVAPLDQPDLADLLDHPGEADLFVVLDQITDPHNVGAILRSAAAFGARAVITTERNAPPESGALAKAAAGALEAVPLVRVINLARALRAIAETGVWIFGLEATGDRTLAEADPSGRCALVFGAEGSGLRRLTGGACDEIVRLPIAGAVNSLNVSNAAAVALYELVRKPHKPS